MKKKIYEFVDPTLDGCRSCIVIAPSAERAIIALFNECIIRSSTEEEAKKLCSSFSIESVAQLDEDKVYFLEQ